MISIILPIYNECDELAISINSVLNQTFSDFELICIDDASTSTELLESFTDSRIKIIKNKENKGPGYSRNKGLDIAKGEYIFFLDAGDYIFPNTLELLHNNITSNDSDCVIYKFNRVNSSEDLETLLSSDNSIQDDLFMDKILSSDNLIQDNTLDLTQFFQKQDYNNFTFSYKDIKKHVMNTAFAPWTKLYRRSLLEDNNIRFPEIRLGEDVLFHIKVMLNASKISFCPEFLYNYHKSKFNSSNVKDIIYVINSVESFLKENNYYEEFKLEFTIFKIGQLTYYARLVYGESFNLIKEELSNIDRDILYLLPKEILNRLTSFISYDKNPTKILIGESVFEYKKSILTISLVNYEDKPVINRKINFNFGNSSFSVITNNEGKASLESKYNPGVYNSKVTFEGDSISLASSIDYPFEILKVNPKFTIKETILIHKKGKLTILCSDLEDNPLIKRYIRLKLLGGVVYTKLTDNEGYVYLDINYAPGDYTGTVSYDGDGIFNQYSEDFSFKVIESK